MRNKRLFAFAVSAIALSSVATLLGQGQASRVEWVMPGRPSAAFADVKYVMPGQASNFSESKIEWVMPGRDPVSEYTMPGQESRDERSMPGQESSAGASPAQGDAAGSQQPADPHELDNLFAPYALCSDPLLAIVLAASTAAEQVDFAAAWMQDNADPATLDGQRIRGSVKALARFPDILAAMARDAGGTRDIGNAMRAFPRAALDTVQRLRASARGLGNLVPGSTQRLVSLGADLQILPADPRFLHTPYYDPAQAFDGQIHLEWDAGIPVGSWSQYGIDWPRRIITDRSGAGGTPASAGDGGGFASRSEVEAWRERARQSQGLASEEPLGYADGHQTEQASARGRASASTNTQ